MSKSTASRRTSSKRRPRPQRKRPQCQLEFFNWARSLALDRSEKLLLMLLVSHVDTDDSGICWPTQSELAAMMDGLTERHIRALTRRLEDRNLIYVEHRWGRNGGSLTNVYHIDPATDPTLTQSVNGKVSTEVVQNFAAWFAATHRTSKSGGGRKSTTGGEVPGFRRRGFHSSRNRTIGTEPEDQEQREREAHEYFVASTGGRAA
jgi:hypothetical protein